MDSLSPNTVLTSKSFVYSNSDNQHQTTFKDTCPYKKQNNDYTAPNVLFRKQSGDAWIIIVRQSSGNVQGFFEKKEGSIKPMHLKGVPRQLQVAHIEKAKATFTGSRFSLTDSQIEVVPSLKGGMKKPEEEILPIQRLTYLKQEVIF
jgi:hypothetical protein